MSTELEKKVLSDLAAVAEQGLLAFMSGLSDEVFQSWHQSWQDPAHFSLGMSNLNYYVDGARLDRLLNKKRADYYTKWITTMLKLAEEGNPDDDTDSFDRLNAAFQTTALYRWGSPLTIYIFEGNYYLMGTHRYKQSYGEQKLGAPRYTTAAAL